MVNALILALSANINDHYYIDWHVNLIAPFSKPFLRPLQAPKLTLGT